MWHVECGMGYGVWGMWYVVWGMRYVVWGMGMRYVAWGSVVLVWLYIIRFSFSKKANKEQSIILVLVSQLKRKKGY